MHEVASQDAGCLGFQGRVTSSARAILTLPRSASASSQRITGDPDAVTRSQYSKAALARDDGLRRVRKLTWRVGLLSAAAAAVIGAKFAHITAMLPHLSVSGSSSSSGSSSTGTSSGTSSSSGISSSSGGGVATSGGS
jgi:hypothetical protein